MASPPSRKRLRTSHACDTCRSRKTRCDGGHPCDSCSMLEQECTYGLEANSRGKSDLILEGVSRVERALDELNRHILSNQGRSVPLQIHPQTTTPSPAMLHPSSTPATETSAPDTFPQPPIRTPIPSLSALHSAGDILLDNAVLDSMHTSTTESILQWPHFDAFPSLRGGYTPIFQLEQSRPSPMTTTTHTAEAPTPFLDVDEVDDVLDSFGRTVNFWYPTLSQDQMDVVRRQMHECATSETSVSACLALLVMALGCAGQATTGLFTDVGVDGRRMSDAHVRRRASRRRLADLFFESALKKLHAAHMTVSSTATQCLFFTALYFASVTRPLQAWEYISATAAKCLLLLAYAPQSEDSQDQERVRRIFWACYILESDYLAELSACPSSGIARVESSISLPGSYHTHTDPDQEEQSSLYFLACISMRRLLNRVHQLLYARDSGAARNTKRFPQIVAELQHQLDEWRDVLPPAFAFSLDGDGGDGVGAATAATTGEKGGFLRQRYLTCRSVIYRPYLMWLLSGVAEPGGNSNPRRNGTEEASAAALGPDALDCCKICLDSCLAHILHLRGFAHTVLVDTWICSLSMAGAMLVLLAASRVPVLRRLLSDEVYEAGAHLVRLLEEWRRVSNVPVCPSVCQSVAIIQAADRFIKDVKVLEEGSGG